MERWNFIYCGANVFKQQTFKFDCTHLLDEIEMSYQELCDVLVLPFEKINRTLCRTALAYTLEDTVNKLTDSRFRDHVSLTKNLISHYLENDVQLDKFDLTDIEEIFVQPIVSETIVVIGKLLNKFDRYYSKWEVKESDTFPVMEIIYKGDYRIDEWHQIQDVPSHEPVAIKRHRIIYDDMVHAVRDALFSVEDLAASDIPEIIDDIIQYYAGKQVDELYKVIVDRIKLITGERLTGQSSKAFRQVKSILKNLEGIPAFRRFVEEVLVAETIYTEQTATRVIFDLVMPSKSIEILDVRKTILDEIDAKGYVSGDIAGKVEIIYG